MNKLPESKICEYDELPAQMKQALHAAEQMFNPSRHDTEPTCMIFGHNRTKCQFSLGEKFSEKKGKETFAVQLSILCCNQNIEAICVLTEAAMLATTMDPMDHAGGMQEMIKRLEEMGAETEVNECLILLYETREWSYTGINRISNLGPDEPRGLTDWTFMRVTQDELAGVPMDQQPQLQGCFAKAQMLIGAMVKESIQEQSNETPPPAAE